MSHINISNIVVHSNPSSFLAPFKFSVTFECLQPIKEEIEWKVVYVGSPKDEAFDQVLDSFAIGPFTEVGVMQFEIETPAPVLSKIPTEDILGVSALIHSVSYRDQEFFRVGYFVYNNYEDPFLMENPFPLQVDKIVRNILADKPRIIRHNINWENQTPEKLKALNDIIIENANVINNDPTIQFKGQFSDVTTESTQNSDSQKVLNEFNGYNWGNHNFQISNNNFGFSSGKENYNNKENAGSFEKIMGFFGEDSQNNQQYGSNCFTNYTNEPDFFNQNNEDYPYGCGFFRGNMHDLIQNGLDFNN